MTYLLRQIPDTLWVLVKQRARREGHSLRFILLTLLDAYVQGGLPATQGPRWPDHSGPPR
jgi:hypothetical protein